MGGGGGGGLNPPRPPLVGHPAPMPISGVIIDGPVFPVLITLLLLQGYCWY